MTTRYYVDAEGRYLGGFQGAEPPAGAVEVAEAPQDAGQVWTGAAWGAVPPQRWLVPKLVIIDRVLAANRGTEAIAALAASPLAKLRFDAAVEIANDEPAARALIEALGLDPDVILARP